MKSKALVFQKSKPSKLGTNYTHHLLQFVHTFQFNVSCYSHKNIDSINLLFV